MIDQGWYYHCPRNFVSSHATCQSPLIKESLLFKANPDITTLTDESLLYRLDPGITALIDESLLFKANPPQSVLPAPLYLYFWAQQAAL